jgi:hypothetical protein
MEAHNLSKKCKEKQEGRRSLLEAAEKIKERAQQLALAAAEAEQGFAPLPPMEQDGAGADAEVVEERNGDAAAVGIEQADSDPEFDEAEDEEVAAECEGEEGEEEKEESSDVDEENAQSRLEHLQEEHDAVMEEQAEIDDLVHEEENDPQQDLDSGSAFYPYPSNEFLEISVWHAEYPCSRRALVCWHLFLHLFFPLSLTNNFLSDFRIDCSELYQKNRSNHTMLRTLQQLLKQSRVSSPIFQLANGSFIMLLARKRSRPRFPHIFHSFSLAESIRIRELSDAFEGENHATSFSISRSLTPAVCTSSACRPFSYLFSYQVFDAALGSSVSDGVRTSQAYSFSFACTTLSCPHVHGCTTHSLSCS